MSTSLLAAAPGRPDRLQGWLYLHTDEYNKETGALSTQSTIVEGKTKKVTSVANSLGELVGY